MNTQQQHLETKKSCSHDFQVSCSNCRLNSICLPFSLEARDIDELDRAVAKALDQAAAKSGGAVQGGAQPTKAGVELTENVISKYEAALAKDRLQAPWPVLPSGRHPRQRARHAPRAMVADACWTPRWEPRRRSGW